MLFFSSVPFSVHHRLGLLSLSFINLFIYWFCKEGRKEGEKNNSCKDSISVVLFAGVMLTCAHFFVFGGLLIFVFHCNNVISHFSRFFGRFIGYIIVITI